MEAHYFPAVALDDPLRVNYDTETLGQSYQYTVHNQFIEVTNTWTADGTWFYYHELPTNISQLVILDKNRKPVVVPHFIEGNKLYHTLDGDVYWIKYFTEDAFHEDLVTYFAVLPRIVAKPGAAPRVQPGGWGWTHGVIDLPDRTEYRFRWFADNRYQILDPYTVLPNDPWYVRIRHNVAPRPPEWARMIFHPYRPYLPATWGPANIADDHHLWVVCLRREARYSDEILKPR